VTRRAVLATLAAAPAIRADSAGVHAAPLPAGGIQPDATVGANGRIHLVYLAGDKTAADVFYTSGASASSLDEGLRVNSSRACAVPTGTIRGAQLALGADGLPHIAWNGAGDARPAPPVPPGVDPAAVKHRSPMLYSRLDASGKSFEPQRNLMTRSYALDGGGSVAADAKGNVYVGWHAHLGEGPQGEQGRRVWLARSTDAGATFSPEDAVFGNPKGACACCGLRFFAAGDGTVYGAYRSAFETVHRDLYLLRSSDRGKTFSGFNLHKWEIGACPMSSMHFVEAEGKVWLAWETAGQVWFARADEPSAPISAPGKAGTRKHPRLAVDAAGRMLLTWTSVPGWAKPGELGWALYDPKGQLADSGGGEAVPVWSFAAPVAGADGFAILI
jgi:hypothetical protein